MYFEDDCHPLFLQYYLIYGGSNDNCSVFMNETTIIFPDGTIYKQEDEEISDIDESYYNDNEYYDYEY